jgi:uncharacterized damage-inducible protein DinB
MKIQEIKKLFAFNNWATNRILEALSEVPEADYGKSLKASYGSLRGTLTHLVAAEKIWLSRLTGKPETSLMTEEDAPTLQDLKSAWEEVAGRMAKFLVKLDDEALQKSLRYVTTRGETFTNTFEQILQHIVNHASYHRGQITVLLRQLGFQPVNTDIIAFFRHTAPKRGGE